METPTVCVRWCIPEAEGTVPLPLTLFSVHYTNGNTDGLCPLVYFRGEGNYSLPLALFTVKQHRGKYSPNNQWKQQQIVSICVF